MFKRPAELTRYRIKGYCGRGVAVCELVYIRKNFFLAGMSPVGTFAKQGRIEPTGQRKARPDDGSGVIRQLGGLTADYAIANPPYGLPAKRAGGGVRGSRRN